jgi:hypothetical protein
MRNALFFLFLIAAVWLGIEVMNNGFSGALDGLFGRAAATAHATPEPTLPQRTGQRVDSALRAGEARVERGSSE